MGAVTEFTATELARTDEEEKKLKKIIKAKGARTPRGRRTSSASTARSRDTWQGIAGSKTLEEGEKEDSLDETGEIVTPVSNF